MFVTNHVLSGVIIGRAFERRPVAAFVAGVGSHLLLDAMPHFGLGGKAMSEADTERFLRMAKRDGLLGLAAMAVSVMAVDRRARLSTAAAMAGAVLLDLDKPSLYFFGVNPFPPPVRRFHERVQNESPRRMPLEVGYGLAFTLADAVVAKASRSH
ncbi:MAG: hypothetical protein ABSC90_14565 [Acidimicrobiales bacterium]|jgi:hypothetical protein